MLVPRIELSASKTLEETPVAREQSALELVVVAADPLLLAADSELLGQAGDELAAHQLALVAKRDQLVGSSPEAADHCSATRATACSEIEPSKASGSQVGGRRAVLEVALDQGAQLCAGGGLQSLQDVGRIGLAAGLEPLYVGAQALVDFSHRRRPSGGSSASASSRFSSLLKRLLIWLTFCSVIGSSRWSPN